MVEETARIRIRRSNKWFGWFRRLWVLIDETKVHGLKHGEHITLTVTPGEHTIQVQMDWCKTAPFSVNCTKEETIDLECGSRQLWSSVLGIVLWPSRIFFVRREDQP